MTKPKASMRISGGSPAGFADFKPLNPHGAPMPKLSRPMPSEREGKPPHVDLFQLWVDTPKGPLRILPKAPKEFLEPMLAAINRMIIDGREATWREPRLLPAEATLSVM